MPERTVAEVFPPGEFIKEEIEARGWSQSDLAEILGVNDSVVSALINGKKSVTPDLAKALGAAFETSAQLWMNLESSYRLFHAENTDALLGHVSSERGTVETVAAQEQIPPLPRQPESPGTEDSNHHKTAHDSRDHSPTHSRCSLGGRPFPFVKSGPDPIEL